MVIVVNLKLSGICTMTVPVCPERVGVIVEVVKVDPAYVEVSVVNCSACGTCTITVPICPGRLGLNSVAVVKIVPV
jgi:hypothetical protein